MKISRWSLLLVLFIIPKEILARDINLDAIYIKKTSVNYKKLMLEKMDTYRKIGAVFVDRDVIFSNWISGDEIIYIRENDLSGTNYIFKYKLSDRSVTEICKLRGVITIAKLSTGRKFLVIKRFIHSTDIIPKGERLIINLKNGNIRKNNSPYAFLDFSFGSEGDSIIFEKKTGIVEYFPDSGVQHLLIRRNKYKDIIISNNPAVAHISSDRQKLLIINGSGGNYKAKLIMDNNSAVSISGISSATEVFWLDNFNIIYRKGYAGNYSVVIYNIKKNKSKSVLKKSFNTNISLSGYSNNISFLKEQLIFFCDKSGNGIYNTGIEGEDISFEPNGNKFVSLLYKKLFIINLNKLKKKRIELRRSWKSILATYRILRNKKQDFENTYSGLYIDRKILVYKDLINI